MKTLAALRLADPPFCANLWQIREGNGFAVVGYPGAPHHEVMNERATAHSLRLYLGFRLSQVAFDSDRLQREGWPTHTLVYRPPGPDFLHDCEHASAFVELRMTDRALRTLAGPKASLTMMPSRPLVSPALGSTIHDLHSCLYGASRDDAMALEEAAMNFAAQAATLLDRNGASSATLPGRLSTQQLHRAIEFIEANLSHQISLADIAAHTQLSIFYFAKAFRAGTGSAPHQYLTQRRLLHARALLQTTDEDLTGVAIDTGFSSQSHFTETFRRQIGTTPRRYRDATCGRR